MKVWIVIADTFNGEYSEDKFDSVWETEDAANAYVAEMNAKRNSAYSEEYRVDWDAHEVRK